MNAKKFVSAFVLSAVMAAAAFAAEGTVTVKSLNSKREIVDVEVKANPAKVAILDLASLDIIDALGLGDTVVGSAGTRLSYLQKYVDGKLANLGSIKQANLEATMAAEPDVIFSGLRLQKSYDALSEIAPNVMLTVDTKVGLVESVRANATQIASLFGVEEKVAELMAGFDARIAKLREISAGKTAIVALVTSGGFNILGNDGRCGLIGKEAGFENIGLEGVTKKGEKGTTATHGNEASFEFVLAKNPDYIFVMDRDAAIGAQGAKLAKEVVENELVMKTDAYKNGQIIYLANPEVWYTAEGGITALDIMLKDLESVLIK